MTLEEKKAYIRANYGTLTPKEISEDVALEPGRVRQIARRMGLYRQAPRRSNKAKCKPCMLYVNGVCIYNLEAEASRCRNMRFTTAKFPTDGRNE